jgi:hypothetical protein
VPGCVDEAVVLEGRLRRMSSRSSGIEKTFSAGLVIVEERLEA